MRDTSGPPTVWRIPATRSVFAILVAILLLVAWGHWFLVAGNTTLYLGLPQWLWLQVVVVVAMLCIAWLAVTVWTTANQPVDGE